MALGWNFTEPEILQSQGIASARFGDFIFRELIPRLDDLASRLQAPSARFLDVGTGVGAISIAACRFLPNLHAIGLEPQDAPLTEARRNITAAGLTDRIELREQRIEDMADKETFDLAFLPQSFMSDDVVKRGFRISGERFDLAAGSWCRQFVFQGWSFRLHYHDCVIRSGVAVLVSHLRYKRC